MNTCVPKNSISGQVMTKITMTTEIENYFYHCEIILWFYEKCSFLVSSLYNLCHLLKIMSKSMSACCDYYYCWCCTSDFVTRSYQNSIEITHLLILFCVESLILEKRSHIAIRFYSHAFTNTLSSV